MIDDQGVIRREPPRNRLKERFTLPKGKRPQPPAKHTVSDHALMRYFERVLGLDIEAIRSGILTAEQDALVRSGVECKVKLANGIYAVAKGGVVVTIK